MADKSADKFVAAVTSGATVYAHPDTAIPPELCEITSRIKRCSYIEVGKLFAVDMGYWRSYEGNGRGQ